MPHKYRQLLDTVRGIFQPLSAMCCSHHFMAFTFAMIAGQRFLGSNGSEENTCLVTQLFRTVSHLSAELEVLRLLTGDRVTNPFPARHILRTGCIY
jgi:hypothetical protein